MQNSPVAIEVDMGASICTVTYFHNFHDSETDSPNVKLVKATYIPKLDQAKVKNFKDTPSRTYLFPVYELCNMNLPVFYMENVIHCSAK